MTRAGNKKARRERKILSMWDLPEELVAEKILKRVPITSLRSVRSTCKLWNALTKGLILGDGEQFFLGFMTKESKLCSVRFRSKYKDDKDEDLLDHLSVKEVDLFDEVKISRVFHCDGLLLCEAMCNSRLLMWNPYLGQTQWIGLTPNFDFEYCYALGYDINRNHKILRFLNYVQLEFTRYEIYDFSSNSWRVLKVTPDNPNWVVEPNPNPGGVSLKGNTYFYAQKDGSETMEYAEYFLLCFDFTTERFGPHLPLPLNNIVLQENAVTLSSLREQKLALLYHAPAGPHNGMVQIWVTTTIEPNHVSWSQFLRVEVKPFSFTNMLMNSDLYYGWSFFIDEEEKVAVVFDINLDGSLLKGTGDHHHTAFVIGEGGYFKSVSLGVAHNFMKSFSGSDEYNPETHYSTPLMCSSSYRPSLVQLNQTNQRRS